MFAVVILGENCYLAFGSIRVVAYTVDVSCFVVFVFNAVIVEGIALSAYAASVIIVFAVGDEITVIVVIPGETLSGILLVIEYVARQKVIIRARGASYRITVGSQFLNFSVYVNIDRSAYARRSAEPVHESSAVVIEAVADDKYGKLITISESVVIIFGLLGSVTFGNFFGSHVFRCAEPYKVAVFIADYYTVDCRKISYALHRDELEINACIERTTP